MPAAAGAPDLGEIPQRRQSGQAARPSHTQTGLSKTGNRVTPAEQKSIATVAEERPPSAKSHYRTIE
jgi:hypothetical protein